MGMPSPSGIRHNGIRVKQGVGDPIISTDTFLNKELIARCCPKVQSSAPVVRLSTTHVPGTAAWLRARAPFGGIRDIVSQAGRQTIIPRTTQPWAEDVDRCMEMARLAVAPKTNNRGLALQISAASHAKLTREGRKNLKPGGYRMPSGRVVTSEHDDRHGSPGPQAKEGGVFALISIKACPGSSWTGFD